MIFLKTDEEVELMRQSNILLGKTFAELAKVIKPGVTTAQLDKVAYEFIMDNGGKPSCLGYEGFPATLCTSVNEQVVHGIPSDKVVLKDGDIISVDSCILLNGFHSDSAYTFPVGDVKPEVMQLLRTTKEALYLGIEQAITGRRLGDIGATIQNHCERAGYSVVREFVGHGIGRDMHAGGMQLWTPRKRHRFEVWYDTRDRAYDLLRTSQCDYRRRRMDCTYC